MDVIYSIANDTMNGIISSDSLTQEIQDSNITIALDSISTSGDVLTITFKADLISGEKDVLDSIVSSHDGEPLPENDITKVQLSDFHDLTGHNVYRKGYLITAIAGQTTEHEAKYSSDMMLQGVEFCIDSNGVIGDYIEVEMVDVDNILGYGADFVLGKFAETVYIYPEMIFKCICDDAKTLPAGIYLRFKYISIGSNDVKITLQHALRTV